MQVKNLKINPQISYAQELKKAILEGKLQEKYLEKDYETGRARNTLCVLNFPEAPRPLVLKIFGTTHKASTFRRLEIIISNIFKNLAQTSYQGSLNLIAAGVPTPKPIAYWSSDGPPWHRRDYFLYEHYPASSLLQDVRSEIGPNPSIDKHHYFNQLVTRLARLARKMHDAGLRHGDIVTHNILVTEDNTLVLLDTDHVRKARFGGVLKKFLDMHCFKRLSFSETGQLFFLRQYYGRDPTKLEWWLFRFWTRGGLRLQRWRKRWHQSSKSTRLQPKPVERDHDHRE